MATGQSGRSHLRKRSYSQEELTFIHEVAASGASEDEMQILLLLARKYGLDPLRGDICWKSHYFFVRQEVYARIVRNESSYAGVHSFVVCAGDDVELQLSEGVIRHHFGSRRGPVVGAWATCARTDRTPEMCYVDASTWKRTSPYTEPLSGQLQAMAEVLAMRKQFNLEDLQTFEEWAYWGREESPAGEASSLPDDLSGLPASDNASRMTDASLTLRDRITVMQELRQLGEAHGVNASELRAMVEAQCPGVKVPSMDVLEGIRSHLGKY